jgi:hypothetical protein
MISNTFRDLDALPITGQATERDAIRASILNYVTGGTVFILSMVAFYFLGSLQVITTEISTKPIDGAACKMLSAITITRDIGTTFYNAMTGNNVLFGCSQPLSSTSPFCQCTVMNLGSPAFSIRYESVFFATFDECLNSLTYTCAHEYDSISRGYSVSCKFTADGSITYNSKDKITGNLLSFFTTFVNTPFTIGSYMQASTPCSKPLPSAEDLSSAVKAGLPPSYICAPFLTNQPYICSVSSRLSPLQMVAQSSSLATNVMFLLGIILVAVLKRRSQARQGSNSITPTLSDIVSDNESSSSASFTKNNTVGNYSIVNNNSAQEVKQTRVEGV